ncbi:MAG: YhcH/YjgK/YiaL family protein [Bacteroidetes bacterium HGW-Bacteroidetes-17]|jgi:YhcH/YjgK/YiaL family protein|nr:MAG: YhcH/YjgK/YiaL family protein [Bacteroidetes bacterium HGW-Bacteroidetes-17]
MIIDKIENCKLYVGLSPLISKAFDYINNTDLLGLESGRYEIVKDDLFALVQEYNTKNREDCKLEGHFKFIDVQFIISGAEFIGISTLNNHIQISKSEERDIAFYEGDPTFFKLERGMFAIFFPDDLHMPGIKVVQSLNVKKLVIKIRI